MQAISKFLDAKTQFKRSIIYYKPPNCTSTHSVWYRAIIRLAKSVYTRPLANLAVKVPKKATFLMGAARLSDQIFDRPNIRPASWKRCLSTAILRKEQRSQPSVAIMYKQCYLIWQYNIAKAFYRTTSWQFEY